MPTKMIDASEWHSYLDRVSKDIRDRRAELRVISPKIGNQVQAEGVKLLGLAYDSKDHVLEVALEGLDHLIQKPVELHVQEGLIGIESVSILDGDGNRHIVQLQHPVVL